MRSIVAGFVLMCGLAAAQMGHELKLDRTVVLRYPAPNAKVVRITGDFLGGATAMVKSEDGVWSTTVGPLPPGVYKYALRVDGLSVISLGVPSGYSGQFEVKGVHVQR